MALAVTAACGDLDISTPDILTTAELSLLGLTASAPPTTSASISNASAGVVQLIHADGFNTLYVRVSFPAGALASVNGQPVGPQGSVQVTIQPRSGQYGMTLSPAGLEFTASARPTAEFSFARYGDPGDAIPGSYPDVESYLRALRLWEEIAPDRWERISGSGTSGTDALTARLAAGGRFVVAAPR